ncbi:MAG TPA: glycoside hydrolase family 3 N-terminal domain-containing protein [Pyrinomonadaceae bacterium]
MKPNRFFAAFLIVVLCALPVTPQDALKVRPFKREPSSKALKWANDELRKMSLEEKVGQLISVGVNATFLNQDSDAYRTLKRQIEVNKVGGIILFRGSVYESVILVNRMQQLARYPLLISADLEAGAGMRFEDTVNIPWNMAVAATGNPEYARRQGEVTAREARAIGVHQIFAPVVDVNNNAANPVINVRSYGEDPADVARFAAAFTEGAQAAGAIATAKHFPGHGDTAVDSHRGLPEINIGRDRLSTIEFVPFQASVNAGVGAVMVGHIALPQIDATVVKPLPKELRSAPIDTEEDGEIVAEEATMPATLSPVMGAILRKDLKFPGMIVTDAMSMSGLTIYFTQEEASVRALEAGADMLLKPADVDASFRGVLSAVKSGRITEQRIEESARKIMAAKYDLGLVDQRLTPVDAIDRLLSNKDVRALATDIAEHAVTLVRDEDKLVPLKNLKPESKVFNLAVTNGEDRAWISRAFASRLKTGGLKVETIVLDERSPDKDVQKAIEQAKAADMVLVSLYGRVRSGQKLSVGIPDAGARALSAVIEAKKPAIGISFGNPYLLQSFPGLRTYIVAYGDMPALQQAVARALLGEIDVVGKLPISLPGLYPRGTGIQVKKTK